MKPKKKKPPKKTLAVKPFPHPRFVRQGYWDPPTAEQIQDRLRRVQMWHERLQQINLKDMAIRSHIKAARKLARYARRPPLEPFNFEVTATEALMTQLHQAYLALMESLPSDRALKDDRYTDLKTLIIRVGSVLGIQSFATKIPASKVPKSWRQRVPMERQLEAEKLAKSPKFPKSPKSPKVSRSRRSA